MDAWNNGPDEGSDAEDGNEEGALSSGYSSISCTIFLIDAAKEMFEDATTTTTEPRQHSFKRAIMAARNTLMRKAIIRPHDYISVIFFNTRESNNSMQYPGIYVFMNLKRPCAEEVLAIEDLIDGSDEQFDARFGHSDDTSIHNALRICQSIFTSCGRPRAEKNVLLFTCRDDPHSNKPNLRDQAVIKARDFKECGIHLEILHMGENFNMDKFYKQLVIENRREESDALDDESEDERTRNEHIHLPNPITRFEELNQRVKHFDYRNRLNAKLKFTIAPGVQMAVGVYSLVRTSKKPSKKSLHSTTNVEVKSVRKDVIVETGETMSRSDYVYYKKYGGRQINLTMDEALNLINIYEPGIELLGFKSIDWLQKMWYYKEPKFIYPKENMIEGSNKMFAALLNQCMAKGVLALVRFKMRYRAKVVLGALVPNKQLQDDDNNPLNLPYGFIMHCLPIADHFCSVELKERSRAEERQVDLARKFIRKLRFDYKPEQFENPDFRTMEEIIQSLALNREKMEKIIDKTVPNVEAQDRKAGTLMREFSRGMFEPPPRSQAAKTKLATSALLANKRVKIDNDNLDVETMVRRGQAQQLSVPVLKAWLTARGVSIAGKKKAELMQAVIDAVCA